MNKNLSRKEKIRLLRLAEAGKLSPDDLVSHSDRPFRITLDLRPNAWFRPDGSRITIQEKAEESRKKGAGWFVTLDLS